MADRFEPEAGACPVCNTALKNWQARPNGIDGTKLYCPLCGEFMLSGTLMATLNDKLDNDIEGRTKVSHAIRKMQASEKGAELYSNTIDAILKRPLPSIKEQANLLIRWLAENSPGPGESVYVEGQKHRTIIGAKSEDGFIFILNYLIEQGLIYLYGNNQDNVTAEEYVTLSVKGWDYYEEIRKGTIIGNKAFMAMQFGNTDLESMLENVFKPSVLQTGFVLNKLDDVPKAGLIDDRLRVEIQNSVFIIADLTHDNLGAYWEAGYAEGLGKPVIYTCEKSKFDEQKTHFDTNHHLTIKWDINEPKTVGEDLKATIRATLPELSTMGKKLISINELQDILTTEIREYDTCKECGPLLVRRLLEPDEFGSNWTTSDYIKATGVSPMVVGPIVEKVVNEAKAKYNLAP